MPFTASQKSPFVTSDNISRFDYNDNRPAHNDQATTWRRLHQTWHFFSRRRPGEFSPRFCSIIPSYTCCSPMLDFQTWYHKMMQVAPSDLARELANRPTVLLASAEFLASTEVPLRHLHRAHSINLLVKRQILSKIMIIMLPFACVAPELVPSISPLLMCFNQVNS